MNPNGYLAYQLMKAAFFVVTFAQFILTSDLVNANVIVPAPEVSGSVLNGNSLLLPFDTSQSGRLQQVYNSSIFSSLPPGGGWINAIYFRVDQFDGRPFSVVIPNIQINLSTISAGADSLSPIFQANLGANDTAVFGPTSVNIHSAGGNGVTGYGVFFDLLENPFYYNPADGNLLMDMRIYAGVGTDPHGIVILDAFDISGDSVSSVSAYGSSLPSVGQTSTLGLATEFNVIPVPEPSSFLLVGFGLCVLIFWRKLSKRRKDPKNGLA